MQLKTAVVPLAVLALVGLGTAEIAAHPKLVGSGSTSVARCSSSARVRPEVGNSLGGEGYEVTVVDISSASECAGLTYRLSLLDANHRQLAESTGQLNRYGAAQVTFDSVHIPASALVSMAVSFTSVGATYFR